MKKINLIIAGFLFSILAIAGNSDKLKVDQKVSSVEWIGKKVTGEHMGSVSIKSGELMIEDEMIVSGQITIDMNSILVTDIKDEGTNQKLKGHLMSDDFFGVKNHPEAHLKITSVEKQEGNIYTIIGDLTIKGKTQKVEFPATIKSEEGKIVAIGELEIDRTKFDIRYGSGQFFEDLGDRMIYDNFTIRFKIGARS